MMTLTMQTPTKEYKEMSVILTEKNRLFMDLQ